MFTLHLGGYVFRAGSAKVAVSQNAVLTEYNVPYAHDVRYDVQGRLYADTVAEITAASLQMERAIKRPFQDCWIEDNDGARSAINLKNSETIGGVILTGGPNFPNDKGADYTTFRDFSFTVQARVPLKDITIAILSFTETLSYSGGGPVFAHKRAINGPPQKQMVWAQTEFVIQQTGSVRGYAGYPNVDKRIISYRDLKQSPNYTRRSPKRMGNTYYDFQVDYSMIYEMVRPLAVFPALWI